MIMFFSVKRALRIGGKAYLPCICYEADNTLEPTVKKLVAEGKACSYDNRVFFQNGRVIKTEAEKKAEKKAEEKAQRKADRKVRKAKKEATELVTVEEAEIAGF